MSRLIVKNLSDSVTTDKLKEVFSQKGFVTDVQLKYYPDGKFRHFGFVGFRHEEDAQAALQYFNSSYINGSRITVELCSELGGSSKLKRWSKHDSFNAVQEKEENDGNCEVIKKKKHCSVVNDALKKYEDDPMFKEFLEARSTDKHIWSNDNVVNDKKTKKSDKKKKSTIKAEDSGCGSDNSENDDNDDDKTSKHASANISDMEYLKSKIKADNADEQKPDLEKCKAEKTLPYKFYTVKVKGVQLANIKKRDVKQFFSPLKPCSIRLNQKYHGFFYVGFSTEKEMKQAVKKNRSFIAGCRVNVYQFDGKDSVKFQSNKNKWDMQSDSLKEEESIGESGRIFVRNLSYTVTENDLETLFSKYGPLTEVTMPIDRISRQSKGFAIITFLLPEHALKAYLELDGSILHGRYLHLLPGKAKKSIEEMIEMEGLTYLQKKNLMLKAQAANSNSWNTLFLGMNAVADLMAKNYNTSKEKVLDVRGSESLAVRMALGETQIVNDTRQFLLDNGVHLDAFNQPTTLRSKTVILVKNLPAETIRSEIIDLFSKFGELGRVLLPPSGVTAIVEFLEPFEAKAAFKKLAYSKFKYTPLFLEWAPENSFSTPFSRSEAPKASEIEGEKISSTVEKLPKQESMDKAESSSEEEEEIPEPDTTLFIKNLNYETREEAIKEHFKKLGPIHDVTIAKKKDPKNLGKYVSQGYGFIQFKRNVSLEKALKSYQCSVLDGHSLELKRSNRTLQSNIVTARKHVNIGKQTGSKIIVKNVPFQATHKEIRDLFKTFGEIKSVRLPQKMAGTGSSRGFAFVEYYARHDAKRALKSLCQSTHLYGRRLVLEWANAEENVDQLRRKTASQFSNFSSHQHVKGLTQFDIGNKPTEMEEN